MKSDHKPRILSIAGSDSGGGAGIQADLKTITALGGYGMSAITAITAQNTLGVSESKILPVKLVEAQIEAVMSDIGVDAVKTGMLGNKAMIHMLASMLGDLDVPFVLDPVMLAKGGQSLLARNAVAALQDELIPVCTMVTPNIPEAEVLAGIQIHTMDHMREAAMWLMDMGAQSVLLKGGHMTGDTLVDFLVWDGGEVQFESARIDTPHTHGTGCTLASAIATGLGRGLDIPSAVKQAREYVRAAILAAPGFGAGHGPMDHGWPCNGKRFDAPPARV